MILKKRTCSGHKCDSQTLNKLPFIAAGARKSVHLMIQRPTFKAKISHSALAAIKALVLIFCTQLLFKIHKI